jgi:predicted ATPase/class 3 adenylate cyclase
LDSTTALPSGDPLESSRESRGTDASDQPSSFTFLFTDIVSSSRFWDLVPEQMDHALARHDSILADAVSSHGGGLVKHTGDGMLAVFDLPVDGVLAAIDAQRALDREPWDPAAVIQCRMGVHLGPAIVRRRDYFGTSPIRCSRIMGLAAGGQVLVSGDVARSVDRDKAVHGFSLHDLGEHQLRGLSRPEHIFQVHADGLRTEFPTPAWARSSSVVPRQPVALIGRDDEVESVRELLARHPLVTIVGPGGVGKTSLAVRVAALERDDRQRAVAFVDLAPTYSSIVADTVARAVGADWGGEETPLDALCRTLADIEVLLVLDNAEHVLGAVSQLVSTVLARCPGVVVLATSQVPIGVTGARSFTLDPLDSGPGGAAVQLFIDRAREADNSFDPAAHLDDIASLCTALDGLPLAIELAARRVRSLEPSQISERLDHRLRFLRVPEGHAQARRGDTLGAVIAWSWDLLDPNEQLVLVRLGVFRGPFTLSSAEAIVGFDPIDGWAVGDVLDQLVRRSLVTVEGQGPLRRYRLLESISAFAAERLSERDGGGRAVRERHARHYLAGLVDLDPTNSDRVDALDLESANVRAAVAWSATDDPAATARLLLDRYRMLRDLGWYEDAQAWFTIVAARDPFDDPEEQTTLLDRLGRLAMATGRDLDQGRSALETALGIAEAAGLRGRELQLRLSLATALSFYPAGMDLEAAREHLQVLESALEQIDNPATQFHVHLCAAFVHLYRRESEAGVERARLAGRAAAHTHLPAAVANARALEGANMAYSGEIDLGLGEMEAAWDQAQQAGDATVSASVAWLRGYASVLLADPLDAQAWFHRGLEIQQVGGRPLMQHSLKANLGIALVLMGRLDEAEKIARDRLSINGTLLEPLLAFTRADFDESNRMALGLIERLHRAGDRNQGGAVSYWIGRFSNTLGYTDQAVRHLLAALEPAIEPSPCPYYEVPVRAELALAGDASQLPRLRQLADTVPLRGLETRVRLAEARHSRDAEAEQSYDRALAVADRYALVMDRVEVLTRRSFHRLRRGDLVGREADVAEALRLCREVGLAGRWEFAMEPSQ